MANIPIKAEDRFRSGDLENHPSEGVSISAGPLTCPAPATPHLPIVGKTVTLAIAALGVVYGDIGTSPLYAVRECFNGPYAIALNEVNLFGVVSLIFWSLTIVITVKYV
jgi:KUP system potassium uptake protein